MRLSRVIFKYRLAGLSDKQATKISPFPGLVFVALVILDYSFIALSVLNSAISTACMALTSLAAKT